MLLLTRSYRLQPVDDCLVGFLQWEVVKDCISPPSPGKAKHRYTFRVLFIGIGLSPLELAFPIRYKSIWKASLWTRNCHLVGMAH